MIPFKYHGNSTDPDLNNCHRLKLYRKFIGLETIPSDSLDIGEPGYISRELEVFDNTIETDFNHEVKAPAPPYQTITCFEVINHICNPLQFMEQIRDLLRPGGVLYLSCPIVFLIPWHHCRFNFVMYGQDRLETMFEYAGFKVVRSKKCIPWPFRFVFLGIRPVFRFLFNRIVIWELRKL